MKRNLKWISWNDYPITRINRQQWNELIDYVKGAKHLKETKPGNFRPAKYYNTYSISDYNNSHELRLMDTTKKEFRFRYIYNSVASDTSSVNSKECYKTLNDLFRNEYGLSIFSAFSGKKYKDIYKLIKGSKVSSFIADTNVPIQMHYAVNSTGILNNVYKADVSSAFPTQAIKSLPTLHDCKIVNGTAEPTLEYPFAFYTKTRHIKIYGELDTREFNNKFYKNNYEKLYGLKELSCRPQDEITILCKKSEYSLKNAFTDIYNKKNNATNPEERQHYKNVMNVTIGYFHKCGDPWLSHLAAVIIARCIADMINRAEILEKEGNKVWLISTDSIIWTGNLSSIATDNKYLGSFTYEEKYTSAAIRTSNCYQYMHINKDLTQECKTVWSGNAIKVREANGENVNVLGYVLTADINENEVGMKTLTRIDNKFYTKEELEEIKK